MLRNHAANLNLILLQVEGDIENWGFCCGIGYIGNPMSRTDIEQLKISILSAKSYVALAVGDFVQAGRYAESLLELPNLPGAYKMLAHLYAAESLILQDKISAAIKHLDPGNICDVNVNFGNDSRTSVGWSPSDLSEARSYIQYNLAVGFALREEWEKADCLVGPLYNRNSEITVQVLLLNLYIALRQGDSERAVQLVRDRCPAADYSQDHQDFSNFPK